jgi:glycosyltransferase involved in cell wall biosynthesis
MPVEKKYSIILPVRNGGEYVKECVNAILSQSVKNFSLLVLDNHSEDGTLEWVRSLQDERIKIFPAEKPLSIEENWARIKSIQKNEFITIIGHDDVFDRNYLAEMNDLIERYPDANLYQTHFRFINAKGEVIKKCRPMPEIQTVYQFLEAIFTDALDTMGTGYMMRSLDYDTLGGIQPYPNLLFADHELWIRLTALSNKATSASECFSYRLHENVSKKSDAPRYIRAFLRFINFLKEIGDKDEKLKGVIKVYVSDYIRYYCRSLAHRLLRTPESQREGMTVISFIEQCKAYADELAPGNDFHPYEQFNIRLAKQIDSSVLLRRLYLLFRKLYKKPIYSA